MFSGGVDSTTLLFGCMTLGWKPDCYTLQLGEIESPDVIAAKTITKHFNVPLHIIKIPQNEEQLIEDIYTVLDIIEYPKKAFIQVTQPYLYLCDAISKDGYTFAMHGAMADALYGNIQSILINRKDKDEKWWTDIRRVDTPGALGSHNEQRRIAAKYGISIIDPYLHPQVTSFMLRRSWEELNEPKIKMLALLAFPKYWRQGSFYRKPLNMQIGSGIREWHDTLLMNKKLNPNNNKAIIAVYNRMINNRKPRFLPYTMSEVEAMYNNFLKHYTVISTFSGAGGSCLGLKMAGFNVLWASEFIEQARNTYRANHPNTYLDGRDIREVKGKEILNKFGLVKGEIDVLEGSPPCASFSTAGNQAKDWGKVKKYSNKKQRTDDLFFEFTRLLEELKPKTFIAENVSGLAKGCAKGYFKEICDDIISKGYSLKTKLIDAVNLGVPQTRPRLIFIGVQDKYNVDIEFPKPFQYTYNILDAIPDFLTKPELKRSYDKKKNVPDDDWAYHIPKGKMMDLWKATNSRSSKNSLGDTYKKKFGGNAYFTHYKVNPMKPVPTILQTLSTYHPKYPRSLTIGELKRLSTFPDDFKVTGSSMQVRWERIGRAVPPRMMYNIGMSVRDMLDAIYEYDYFVKDDLSKLGLDKDIVDIGDLDV